MSHPPHWVNDLRSDTPTQPCRGMRQAMFDAEVGDDVSGEDPTVNRLEALIAELTGKESGLFVASGVMANQICIANHLLHNPGSPSMFQNVICDKRAHVHKYENGGISINARGHTTPLLPANSRYLTMEEIEKNVCNYFDWHQPMTTLVCLENTLNGAVMPLDEIVRIRKMLKEKFPHVRLHLDGARIWNAATALNVPIKEITQHFDSVSLCMSKGLGAPVGSVLVGTKDFVHRSRELRKACGGGWRQAGMLAAAAIFALQENFGKLAATHAEARRLASGLEALGMKMDMPVETNMVWADRAGSGISWGALAERLKPLGITIAPRDTEINRLVIHHQVSPQTVDTILQEAQKLKAEGPVKPTGTPFSVY